MLISLGSQNRKLGPGVVATYRSTRWTCPADCGLAGNGCYAERFRVAAVSRRSEGRQDDLDRARGAGLVRHLVSGDLLKPTADGRRVLDLELIRKIIAFHRENRRSAGWLYTHCADRLARQGFGPREWGPVAILASCESIEEARRLQRDGWRTARVTEDRDDCEPDELACPYDLERADGVPLDRRTTCAVCRACPEGRRNIVFLKG